MARAAQQRNNQPTTSNAWARADQRDERMLRWVAFVWTISMEPFIWSHDTPSPLLYPIWVYINICERHSHYFLAWVVPQTMNHTQHRAYTKANEASKRCDGKNNIFHFFEKIVFQFVVCLFLWNCWHSSLSDIPLRCGDPRRTNERTNERMNEWARAQTHAQRIFLQLWTILLIMKLANEATAKRNRYHINRVGHRKQRITGQKATTTPMTMRCIFCLMNSKETTNGWTSRWCTVHHTYMARQPFWMVDDANGEKQNMKHTGMEKGERIGRNENNVLCPCCDWWLTLCSTRHK